MFVLFSKILILETTSKLKNYLKLLKFLNIRFSKKIHELFQVETGLPNIDYEYEATELRDKVHLFEKNSIDAKFPKISNKPIDYEPNMFIAIKKNKFPSVQWLVQQEHANVEEKDKNGMTPLLFAAKLGNLKIVEFLTDIGRADFHACDNHQNTAIHYAAGVGLKFEIIRFLREEHFVDVNTKNDDESTPLHNAAFYSNLDAIKYLVENCKVPLNQKDNYGRTPFSIAVQNGNLETVKYFVEEQHQDLKGININQANDRDVIKYLKSLPKK